MFQGMVLPLPSGETYSVGSGHPPIEASLIDRSQQSRFHLKTREEPSLQMLWLKNIRTMDKVQITDHSNCKICCSWVHICTILQSKSTPTKLWCKRKKTGVNISWKCGHRCSLSLFYGWLRHPFHSHFRCSLFKITNITNASPFPDAMLSELFCSHDVYRTQIPLNYWIPIIYNCGLFFKEFKIICARWQQAPDKAFSNSLSQFTQPAATYDWHTTREMSIICWHMTVGTIIYRYTMEKV
jgi:hypothetical protein